MSQMMLEEKQIKKLFKEALLEVLQEHGDLFYDLVVEAIKDTAMVRAIREGIETEVVEKEKVYVYLEGE